MQKLKRFRAILLALVMLTALISALPAMATEAEVVETPSLLAAKTYTVTFNKNGGSGSMSKQTFTVNKSKKLATNKFYRSGYAFTGWAKTKSGKVAYKETASVKNLAKAGKNITLYAVWKKVSKLAAKDFKATGSDAAYISKDFLQYCRNQGYRNFTDQAKVVYFKYKADAKSVVVCTNRGIRPGYSTWNNVQTAYGSAKRKTVNLNTDKFYKYDPTDPEYTAIWKSSKTSVEYKYEINNMTYKIHFYFNSSNKVTLVVYSVNY